MEVIDNGRGIPKEKLDDINRRIRECDHSGKSIGMLNVLLLVRRIRELI